MFLLNLPPPVRLSELIHHGRHNLRLVQVCHGEGQGGHQVDNVGFELRIVHILLFGQLSDHFEELFCIGECGEKPGKENNLLVSRNTPN